MNVLPIGFGRRWGQIKIAGPTEAVKFTPANIRPADAPSHPLAIKHTLAGNWANFPDRWVDRLDVVAHTDRDYKWFDVPVHGAERGAFAGDVFTWHANEITSYRFDGFDQAGQRMFSSDYSYIKTQLVEGPPEGDQAVIDFPEDLVAGISRVVSWGSMGSQLPVAVRFDVQKTPAGTTNLALAFMTDKGISLRVPKGWNGPGEYDFLDEIACVSGAGLKHQAGEQFNVGVSLWALKDEKSRALDLASHRDSFTLYQSTLSGPSKK
jgi:hypothetical protein